jgi:ATP-dependent Clp protease ATP-binding subunit ClpC
MGIELTPAAKELAAKRGFDPVLGARPLRRALQRDVEDILAEKILFGELRPGQIVLVDAAPEGTVDADGLPEYFTFTGAEKSSTSDLELTDLTAGGGTTGGGTASGLQDS